MNKNTTLFFSVGCLVTGATALNAAVLEIQSDAAVYIRASQGNQSGNGSMLIGQTTTTDDFLRSVMSFDLSDPLLAGATINSVTLTFTVSQTDASSSAGAVDLDLHELTQGFDESTVTWTVPWTTPGGDFSPSVLASLSADPTTVSNNDELSFTSVALTNNIASNVGDSVDLISKLAVEDDVARKIFFFYRTGSSRRPTLTVDYTTVPEPSAYAMMAGVVVLGVVACRRKLKK